VDVAEFWNENRSQLEQGTISAFRLLAVAAKRESDALQRFEEFYPETESLEQVEDDSIKIAVLHELWLGAIQAGDKSAAIRIASMLQSSIQENMDSDSIEYAEILAIVGILESFHAGNNSPRQRQRYEVCKKVVDRILQNERDNIAVAMLRAIDRSSVDSMFRVPQGANDKSTAGWIREYVNHYQNEPSVQLEMIAWFSETCRETNAQDLWRMLDGIEEFRDTADWGEKSKTNWDRVLSVASELRK
ncbi:MAG: hypothetical protein AAGA30_14445, partial [Planctomycetota bacterium]